MFSNLSREARLGPSSTASTSLSLSKDVDLEIVNEIMARAAHTSSFPDALQAYNIVLPNYGINPSTDSVYYRLILQVGLDAAPTWGERWANWIAAHEARSVPERSYRPPNPMRARVPFLASASSDLDEGYGDSEAETVTSEVYAGRESPRKAMAGEATRSLVGYTPTPSDVEESFDRRPIRTSTPVHAQDRGYYAPIGRRSIPAAPMYSELEADMTITSPLRTYTPRPRPLVSIEKDIDPAVLRKMELQADQFHRLGMAGRCWEQWRQSYQVIYRNTVQSDGLSDMLLLRRTLAKWRAVNEYRLSQPGTADSHYELKRKQEVIDRWMFKLRDKRLQRLENATIAAREMQDTRVAFKTWHTKLVKRRTKRWEADMRSREAAVTERFDQNRTRRAFDKWHDVARERMADKHLVKTTVKSAFVLWKERGLKSRQLSQNLQSWQRRKDATTIVRTFDLWFKKANLLPAERKLVKVEEARTVARAFTKWQLFTQQQLTANAFDKARLLKGALDRMKLALRKVRARERLAVEYADTRDLTLMRNSMKIWLAQERSKLLQRVLETRNLSSLFTKWRGKKEKMEIMNGKAEQFIAASDTRQLHNSLSRWRDALGQKRNATLKADLIFEARTKHALFTKWHAASAKLADDVLTADKAHAFFTLRVSFKVWRIALARKRQEEFAQKRKAKVLRNTMNWALAQRIYDNQQVDTFRASQDKRILRTTLSLWTERVVEIKARELDVADQRDKSLVADAFGRWRRAHKAKTDLVALMQSFVDVKREESMRRAFMTWAVRTRKAADLNSRLEAFQRERDNLLLSDSFASWYDQKRERDLRPIEDEVRLRHEDALLFSVLDNWIASGRLLRAVQFDKQRLARAVLPKWKKALQRQHKLKALSAEQNSRLLADGFAVWKAAYRAKIAKRPTHRARRRITHTDSLETLRRSASATPPGIRPRRSLGGVGEGSTPVTRTRHRPTAARGGSMSPEPHDRVSGAASVASEPAYSRLRSELLGRGALARPRVPSDESPGTQLGVSGTPSRSKTMAELVQALRAAR